MKFYNLKTRQSVDIADSYVQKQVVPRSSGLSYAVTAKVDGVRLFKFISKAQFDALNVPEMPPRAG